MLWDDDDTKVASDESE